MGRRKSQTGSNEETRCVCGDDSSIGTMIACEHCGVWQHTECVGLLEDNLPELYWCELCKPVGTPSLMKDHPYFLLISGQSFRKNSGSSTRPGKDITSPEVLTPNQVMSLPNKRGRKPKIVEHDTSDHTESMGDLPAKKKTSAREMNNSSSSDKPSPPSKRKRVSIEAEAFVKSGGTRRNTMASREAEQFFLLEQVNFHKFCHLYSGPKRKR